MDEWVWVGEVPKGGGGLPPHLDLRPSQPRCYRLDRETGHICDRALLHEGRHHAAEGSYIVAVWRSRT